MRPDARMSKTLRALISGLMPVLTRLKISMGKGLAPPAVKLEINRSSMLKTKASRQPDTMAGASWGMSTFSRAWVGVAPRSSAASSRFGSNPCRRLDTTMAM